MKRPFTPIYSYTKLGEWMNQCTALVWWLIIAFNDLNIYRSNNRELSIDHHNSKTSNTICVEVYVCVYIFHHGWFCYISSGNCENILIF